MSPYTYKHIKYIYQILSKEIVRKSVGPVPGPQNGSWRAMSRLELLL